MNRLFKNLAIYILIVLIAVSLYSVTNQSKPVIKDIGYSDFVGKVNAGLVKNANIIADTKIYTVNGLLKDNTKYETTTLPDPKLGDWLISKGVSVSPKAPPEPGWWITLLSNLLPVLLLIGLFFFMMNQTQGGGGRVMQFGKSRAKMHTDDIKKRVTFADVAGADEAKEELQEVVEFLKSPKKFTALGARIPKGVLLFGAPGTGKTLLAKAVAGEAGVPFFSISGSDFVEMFVGVGASRVRDLFEQAKKSAPCIIFIDEIDAVGRQRGAGLGGGHDEREQTLNQLLVEMDGFAGNEGIIVIAATNRSDILDPALLRPGRFDRQIVVDIPDVKGRKEILEVHVKGKPLAKDVNLDILARRVPGFTGADLANVTNEAALLAARHNKNEISMEEMEDAVERVIAGPERKSRAISEKEKRLVSYHEAGHALVGYILPNTDQLHKVSIIPRGRAGGYTLLLPREDRRYMTRSQIIDEIAVLLAGRVAEELVLKDISTGAQNDLERATEWVRKMITEYGMSKELGPLTFGKRQEQVFLGRDIARDRNYSEAVAFSIDKEARRIIEENYERVREVLLENEGKLHLIAQTLMDQETLEAEEFEKLIKSDETRPPLPPLPVEKDAKTTNGKQDQGEGQNKPEINIEFSTIKTNKLEG